MSEFKSRMEGWTVDNTGEERAAAWRAVALRVDRGDLTREDAHTIAAALGLIPPTSDPAPLRDGLGRLRRHIRRG